MCVSVNGVVFIRIVFLTKLFFMVGFSQEIQGIQGIQGIQEIEAMI
jgi:hypothetical protein